METTAGKSIRLHLGAGDKFWPGFTNWDAHGDQDITGDLVYADFEGTVDEIHSIHLFEHIARLDVSSFLRSWRGMLKPNGLLVMEMPSLDKISKMIVDGEMEPRLTVLGIFGDPRDKTPLMMHQWCYTNKELEFILTECGFHKISFMEPAYHIAKRDLRVEARRKE